MKKHLSQMKAYLELQPLARERKNKNRGIVNILIETYPSLSTLPKEYLVDVVADAMTLDRSYRKILETCPELRGSDYHQKDELETEMQGELGYNV